MLTLDMNEKMRRWVLLSRVRGRQIDPNLK